MLRRVALVRTDVSEERVVASVVPSSPILVILMKEALSSSQTSVIARATRRNIPEDTILHSHFIIVLSRLTVSISVFSNLATLSRSLFWEVVPGSRPMVG
jgi:hypothetical protein